MGYNGKMMPRITCSTRPKTQHSYMSMSPLICVEVYLLTHTWALSLLDDLLNYLDGCVIQKRNNFSIFKGISNFNIILTFEVMNPQNSPYTFFHTFSSFCNAQ